MKQIEAIIRNLKLAEYIIHLMYFRSLNRISATLLRRYSRSII